MTLFAPPAHLCHLCPHAARRGLGSDLHRLGVPDMAIQRILRQTNVSTTATYYIKTAADDVRTAMAKLEQNVPLYTPRGTFETLNHNVRIAFLRIFLP